MLVEIKPKYKKEQGGNGLILNNFRTLMNRQDNKYR